MIIFNCKMFDFNKNFDFLCLWMLLTSSALSVKRHGR